MGIRAGSGLHRRKHPEPVDGCFGCHALTVQFGDAEGDAMRQRDKTFSADQDAYKRLRANGLQPQSPEGAAEVERHQLEQIEIDYKAKLRPDHKEQLKEIQAGVELAAWTGG